MVRRGASRTPETVADLLAVAGPGTTSEQPLVEIRQLGGAFAVPGPHPSVLHPGMRPTPSWRSVCPGRRTLSDQQLMGAALAPWQLPTRLPNLSFTSHPG